MAAKQSKLGNACFREMKISDLPGVMQIENQKPQPWPEEKIRQYLRSQDYICEVRQHVNTTICYVIFRVDFSQQEIRVENIGVHQWMQKHGIGTQAIEHLKWLMQENTFEIKTLTFLVGESHLSKDRSSLPYFLLHRGFQATHMEKGEAEGLVVMQFGKKKKARRQAKPSIFQNRILGFL